MRIEGQFEHLIDVSLYLAICGCCTPGIPANSVFYSIVYELTKWLCPQETTSTRLQISLVAEY